MAEPSENEPTGAGKHAAVALWSVRARVGSFLLIIGIVVAATLLIIENSGRSPKAVTTASTSIPKSGASASPSSGLVGLAGSGIGPGDAPSHRATSKAIPAVATASPLATFGATQAASKTTPSAPRSSTAPAPSPTPSPAPTTSKPPSPSPTPTKHCRFYLGRLCVR